MLPFKSKEMMPFKLYITMEYPLVIFATGLSLLLQFIAKYLYNEPEIFVFLCITMLLDLITGIRKANNNGEVMSSSGLRRTVNKAIQYLSFLVVTHIVSNEAIVGNLASSIKWLPKAAGIYLILIEARSILENIYGQNKEIPVAAIIQFINRVLSRNKLSKNDTKPDNK
jgi:phage-related holin